MKLSELNSRNGAASLFFRANIERCFQTKRIVSEYNAFRVNFPFASHVE